jgi:hypothetical protein
MNFVKNIRKKQPILFWLFTIIISILTYVLTFALLGYIFSAVAGFLVFFIIMFMSRSRKIMIKKGGKMKKKSKIRRIRKK